MNELCKYSTEQLIEELGSRKGVGKYQADPFQSYSIDTKSSGIGAKGPAVILLVTANAFFPDSLLEEEIMPSPEL